MFKNLVKGIKTLKEDITETFKDQEFRRTVISGVVYMTAVTVTGIAITSTVEMIKANNKKSAIAVPDSSVQEAVALGIANEQAISNVQEVAL